MYREVETKEIFVLVVISLIISVIVFMLTEVIWGDLFRTYLRSSYKQHLYTNINLILITGLGIMFGVSIIVNLLIFRDYTVESKFKVNLLAFIITFLILYAISSISIIIIYAEQYSGLSVVQKMSISWLFLAYYSVYILPTPVMFWFLGLIIFHGVLFILMRFLLVKNMRIKFTKNTKNNNEIKKYKLLG